MRRLVDIAVAVGGLVLLAPLLALIALIVRVESPGHPFYGGWRVGRDGRRFRMWKFRTMVRDADRIGPGITARDDARVTAVGRFLRATKLDELPQLVNLLTGELTLIGPRAEVPDIVARYTPEQRRVLAVTPGITGPGQLHYTTDQADTIPADVAADDYYVDHLLAPKLRIDIDYAAHRTLRTDLRILKETVGVVARAFIGRTARA